MQVLKIASAEITCGAVFGLCYVELMLFSRFVSRYFFGPCKFAEIAFFLWCFVFQHLALFLGGSWVAFGVVLGCLWARRVWLCRGAFFSNFWGRRFCAQIGHLDSAQTHQNKWFSAHLCAKGGAQKSLEVNLILPNARVFPCFFANSGGRLSGQNGLVDALLNWL